MNTAAIHICDCFLSPFLSLFRCQCIYSRLSLNLNVIVCNFSSTWSPPTPCIIGCTSFKIHVITDIQSLCFTLIPSLNATECVCGCIGRLLDCSTFTSVCGERLQKWHNVINLYIELNFNKKSIGGRSGVLNFLFDKFNKFVIPNKIIDRSLVWQFKRRNQRRF